MSHSIAIILLIICTLCNGVYGICLKPANQKCKTIKELELFNTFFSLSAFVCTLIVTLIIGQLTLDGIGIAYSAVFGSLFSICVFSNLKAVAEGPLSITMLIVDFSLIIPLVYSFCFLNEQITTLRIVGIVLLVICMVLFANPKVIGEKRISPKWMFWAILASITNGILALINKYYAINSNNAYVWSYLTSCYFFGTITSLILFLIINYTKPKEQRTIYKQFFKPQIIGIFSLTGVANFGINIIILLLATVMDGAIVYPVVQGGGPIITLIGSWLIFKEKLTIPKSIAIVIGIIAIILLNL